MVVHVFICLSGVDPVFFCARMSELIEKETEEYRKGDPDPFDDRHPGETCVFLSLALIFLLKRNLIEIYFN